MKKRLISLFLLVTMFSPVIPVSAKPATTDKTSKTATNTTTKNYDANAETGVNPKIPNTKGDAEIITPNIISDEYKGSTPEDSNTPGYRPAGGGLKVKVTNMPGTRTVIGTVMRSVNNSTEECRYKPKLKDLPWLESKIQKDGDIATVFAGYYDNPENVYDSAGDAKVKVLSQVQKSIGKRTDISSRATEILGTDLLVTEENAVYENSSRSFIYTGKELPLDSAVTPYNAIMACYKALGDNVYAVTKHTAPHRKGLVPVGETPFAETIGGEDVNIVGTNYYTDIFVTRTIPEVYWAYAYRDGIVSENPNGANSAPQSEKLTVSKFCYYVYKLLDKYGEPVLTEKETQSLLNVYGRNIPQYLNSSETDAAKYLLARGVIDENTNLNEYITAEKMLDILMRAKDKESRYTFKEMKINYESSLTDKGFVPTDMEVSNKNTLSNVVANNDTAASTSTYYDYYIKVTPSTTFTNARGKVVDQIQISDSQNGLYSNSGSEQDIKYNESGSEYLGIQDGYYHLRLPMKDVAGQYGPAYFYMGPTGKECITITSTDPTATPKTIALENGGGVYNDVTLVAGKPYMARQPFTSIYNNLLIDKERKEKASATLNGKVQLTAPVESVFTVDVKDSTQTFWDGKLLKDAKSDDNFNVEFKPSVEGGTSGKLTVKIKGVKDANAEFYKKLKVTSTKSNESVMYVLGGANSSVCMVSANYFMQLDSTMLDWKISNIEKEKGEGDDYTGRYIISTPTEKIVVDPKNKSWVTGQCYTELPESDSSPLIEPSSDGSDYYIDYRVIIGNTAGFMVFDDTDKGKVLSMQTPNRMIADDNENGEVYKVAGIQPLLGEDMQTAARIQKSKKTGKSWMLLESDYAKANFLLYKLNNGTTGDYLIVFRPVVDGIEDPDRQKVKDFLKATFSIDLGDSSTATIYQLAGNIPSGSVAKAAGTRIYNRKGYGYAYEIPTMEEFSYANYYSPTGAKEAKAVNLPIVDWDGAIVDMNCNVVSGWDLGKYPKGWLNPQLYSRTKNAGSDGDYIFGNGAVRSTGSVTSVTDSVRLAPVGIAAGYKGVETFTAKDMKEKQESGNNPINVFAGSMGVKIEKHEDSKDIDYDLKSQINASADGYLTLFSIGVKSSDIFCKIGSVTIPVKAEEINTFSGASYYKNTYVYKDPKGVTVAGLEATRSRYNKTDGKGKGLINSFNWEEFTLLEALRTAEDITTLLYIIFLEIIPRICIFDFFAISTLSLVANISFIQAFCDRVFDPFKVLSLGLLTVHTIDRKKIWLSTFFAIVFLGMLNSHAFTLILDWMLTFAQAIVNR